MSLPVLYPIFITVTFCFSFAAIKYVRPLYQRDRLDKIIFWFLLLDSVLRFFNLLHHFVKY